MIMMGVMLGTIVIQPRGEYMRIERWVEGGGTYLTSNDLSRIDSLLTATKDVMIFIKVDPNVTFMLCGRGKGVWKDNIDCDGSMVIQ